MPGVTVTLTNKATNVARVVQTIEVGLRDLRHPPGTYDLKAELAGFPNHRSAGSRRAGGQCEPNGRNYLQLASLIPGATTNGPSSSQGKQRMGGQRNSFALNVAGQRIHYNHYSLDGIENTDLNFNSYMLLPSVDALQEFKVESGLFDAEYGRAIAQINVSTKSGRTSSTGRCSSSLRNSSLDAKNYFDRDDRPIPPFKRNQYGATVGGPVVVPKVIDGATSCSSCSTGRGCARTSRSPRRRRCRSPPGARGDFSRPARRERQPDPDLRSGDARLRRGRQRDPGADAVSRQPSFRRTGFTRSRRSCSPTTRCRCRSGPAPTTSTTKRGRSTPTSSPTGSTSRRRQRRRWFFRHSISHELGYDPFAIPNMGINTDTDVHQIVLGNTRTFGSNKLNDLRVGVGKLKNAHISPRANVENVVKDARHQPAERQPALLGRAEHRHHRAVRARRRERRAVHQRRQDDSSSSTTSRGPWASTRSSSAASCATCSTTRSAAS